MFRCPVGGIVQLINDWRCTGRWADDMLAKSSRYVPVYFGMFLIMLEFYTCMCRPQQ